MSLFDYMKTPEATYNPYAPAEPAPKKTRLGFKGLRLLFEAALILIIIVLLSGGDTDSAAAPDGGRDTVTAEPAEEQQEPAAAPAFPGAEPDDVVGQGGDALELENLALTASALWEAETSSGEPPTLCTSTTLENTSNTTVRIGSYDWDLQTPSGFIMFSTFSGSDNLLEPSGKLAPGGTISGDVCFYDTSPEAGQHVLIYTPALGDDYEERIKRGAWVNDR